MTTKLNLSWILFIFILLACHSIDGSDNELILKRIPYQLGSPDKKLKLSKKLEEISGLSIRDSFLIAIQDEKGKIFTIDTSSGKILNEFKFDKKDDYEGVAAQADTLYAINAKGDIFIIQPISGSPEKLTLKVKTELSNKNDVEGLCFDASNKRLLLACKGSSSTKKDKNSSRAIFSFDLINNHLEDFFRISKKELESFLNLNKELVNDPDFYQYLLSKDEQMPLEFSGIAIHPMTNDIYVLAASTNSLLILNHNGRIIGLHKLSNKIFEQPEGITFDDQCNLFIASEGIKKKAKIFKYKYVP